METSPAFPEKRADVKGIEITYRITGAGAVVRETP
jgi:hypothetical protein